MKLCLDEHMKGEHVTRVENYLATNLCSILGHGSGSRHPTRAWIYCKDEEKLAHTFDEGICADKESWGGEPIPVDCLSENRECIFQPREPHVLQYLETFGLSKEQAEAVLLVIKDRAE